MVVEKRIISEQFNTVLFELRFKAITNDDYMVLNGVKNMNEYYIIILDGLIEREFLDTIYSINKCCTTLSYDNIIEIEVFRN